jgi:hypothetical protein
MSSDPVHAAGRLALAVWDFLADIHHAAGLVTVTEETRDAIRAEAFRFSREVKSGDEWQIAYGRRLASAVLVWADAGTEESLKAVERASRQYEELRISPPTK